MMAGIDDEAMADIRVQMSGLHDQMLELHMQALQNEGIPDGDEVVPIEGTEAPIPGEG